MNRMERTLVNSSTETQLCTYCGTTLWMCINICSVMLLILGCFTVCWLPYFVLTLYAKTTRRKFATLYEIFLNLAVANSSMNPLIYAWKNKNFRNAFIYLVKCQKINGLGSSNFVTNHIPSKKNSVNGISNLVCQKEDILHSEMILETRFSHVQHITLNESASNGTSEIISKTMFRTL
ncbi:5-hydroxytryptamine receptor 4-like [Anoplophora glabripennis]|uniref:5-hydroxytryptamine receptor 4-like n=1 Tax=Anoplophora glabripennis TaxID=217634 RepID=UPI0008749CBC|nr:5-hydroxytryptamine receptor 4-like [Anoplophora glabripennis]